MPGYQTLDGRYIRQVRVSFKVTDKKADCCVIVQWLYGWEWARDPYVIVGADRYGLTGVPNSTASFWAVDSQTVDPKYPMTLNPDNSGGYIEDRPGFGARFASRFSVVSYNFKFQTCIYNKDDVPNAVTVVWVPNDPSGPAKGPTPLGYIETNGTVTQAIDCVSWDVQITWKKNRVWFPLNPGF